MSVKGTPIRKSRPRQRWSVSFRPQVSRRRPPAMLQAFMPKPPVACRREVPAHRPGSKDTGCPAIPRLEPRGATARARDLKTLPNARVLKQLPLEADPQRKDAFPQVGPHSGSGDRGVKARISVGTTQAQLLELAWRSGHVVQQTSKGTRPRRAARVKQALSPRPAPGSGAESASASSPSPQLSVNSRRWTNLWRDEPEKECFPWCCEQISDLLRQFSGTLDPPPIPFKK